LADAPAERVVRVLPDVPAIDKTFDYLVPDAVGDQVRVGTVVRVQLHGRRVGAWVVADGVEPPPGVALRPLAKVTGWGPAADLIDLAHWAAGAGPAAPRACSAPPRRTTPFRLPGPARTRRARAVAAVPDELSTPPSPERTVCACPRGRSLSGRAAAAGPALILTASIGQARHLGLRLRRAGVDVAIMPKEWPLPGQAPGWWWVRGRRPGRR
jgi:primosomal protein N' (replication factor Y)